jgi:hypothetical protein
LTDSRLPAAARILAESVEYRMIYVAAPELLTIPEHDRGTRYRPVQSAKTGVKG